ncbi:MAG TPA: hypothetical protein QF520_08580 [SAR202 cluster bacterium]|nr:hypothetical protein [SAR202 cluster bacterium]
MAAHNAYAQANTVPHSDAGHFLSLVGNFTQFADSQTSDAHTDASADTHCHTCVRYSLDLGHRLNMG